MSRLVIAIALIPTFAGCNDGRDERAERKKTMDEISEGIGSARKSLDGPAPLYVESGKEKIETDKWAEEYRRWKATDDARRERMAVAWAKFETDREASYRNARRDGIRNPVTGDPPVADYYFKDRELYLAFLERHRHEVRELPDPTLFTRVPKGVYEHQPAEPLRPPFSSRRYFAYKAGDPEYRSIED